MLHQRQLFYPYQRSLAVNPLALKQSQTFHLTTDTRQTTQHRQYQSGTDLGLPKSHKTPPMGYAQQHVKTHKTRKKSLAPSPRSEERRVGKECRTRVDMYDA